ncbi:hypothetical protein NX059_004599 [Plenodomus lindquistii]|nr:hypothetical protein NX059_004599 [Plenodomus lindquistii]
MASSQQLPPGCSLFVATPHTAHLRSAATSDKTLFKCETADGIVNAKASRDNSSLIAIADSHVVILYDTAQGCDRKYQLKKGDGEPRLLLFSPNSQTLYFTTTLSTSVQAYSIPTAQLLPYLPPHPSPPNALAISDNGDILISASPTPPTVFLQDRRWGGSAPVTFQSTDAYSPVTCAAFKTSPQSPSSTTFLLGFQDGALALYRIQLSNQRKPSHPRHHPHLQPIRIGAIAKLHKAAMGGIKAAEFLSGYKARIVSIGHDGRCRLVDFENGGSVLRTWHVDGPATCLSVLCKGPVGMWRGRVDGEVFSGDTVEEADTVYEGRETLIAVGTYAGKVLVFNALGLLVHEIIMDAPVTTVDWVGDMSALCVLPKRRVSITPDAGAVGEALAQDVETSEDESVGTVKKTESPRKSGIPFGRHRDLFSAEPEREGPSRKPSDITTGSPLQRPRKKALLRPRIVTETFTSPQKLEPDSSPAITGSPNLPVVPPRAHRSHPRVLPTTPITPSTDSDTDTDTSGSQDNDFSGPEFFTPRSTRRDTSRLPRLGNHQTSAVDTAITTNKLRLANVSPTALRSSSQR